jgi:hypothetical protein
MPFALELQKPPRIMKMHNKSEYQVSEINQLKSQMMARSKGVGGALTQFKKRKQRRMIKQMMDDTTGNYSSR